MDEVINEVEKAPKKVKAPKKKECFHLWKKIDNNVIRCRKCGMIKHIG